MKGWLQEDVLRRVLKNTGVLGLGKIAGSLLHLATLALSARLLGPYAFGVLILVRSYAQTASGLAKFQSWQTLIRYGAVRAERRDVSGFLDLAAFTVLIDMASGALALIVAITVAQIAGPSLGIPAEATRLAQVYCVAIPFMTAATPNGIMRIFDRFDRLSVQSIVTPFVRLVGIGIAALAGASLWGFALAWLVSDLAGELYLWWHGFTELHRQEFAGLHKSSPRRAIRANDGIVHFAFASNLAGTLNQAIGPIFTLLVGGLLGAAAAGLYRTAQVVVEAVSAPAELAMRSLFPEAARLLSRHQGEFWWLIARALALACLVGLALGVIVALAGPALLAVAMGEDYRGLGPVLRILALGFVPTVAAFPLETALLAVGGAGRLLGARAVSASIALGVGVVLAGNFGLAGMATAATAGAFAAFFGLALLLWLEWVRTRRRDPGGPSGGATA